GYWRCLAERWLFRALRVAAWPCAADRAGGGCGGFDHCGPHVGCRPWHSLGLRAEPVERRGDDGLHPLHRADGVPAECAHREHWSLSADVPRPHVADLRLRARRRPVDGWLDAVLLGLLACVG